MTRGAGVDVGDAQRLRSLRDSGLLDTPSERSFDRIARLVAAALGADVSLVSLVDEDRQFFKAQQGLPEPWASARQTPLSHSFCQHVVAGDDLFVVEDAATDPRVEGNLAIEDLDVQSYAGAPVHDAEGRPLGAVCAIGHQPRTWTDEELAVVRDLADLASELVALRGSVRETRGTVRELSHRVRTGLVAAQLEAELMEPGAAAGVQDGLARVGDAVDQALADLDQQAPVGEQLLPVAETLAACAPRLVARALGRGRELVVDPSGTAATHAPAGELALALEVLVGTLLEHGGGTIRIAAAEGSGPLRLRVQDESQGLPERARKELLAQADSSPTGVSLAERVARSLGGRLVLVSEAPTTFDLVLPARS